MANQLHWLPLPDNIQLKFLSCSLFISELGIALNYLRDHICSPLSAAASHQPLHPLDQHDLFVLEELRTTMAQTRPFVTIGPSLWNATLFVFASRPFSASLPISIVIN